MQRNLIMFRSLTYAQRGMSVLERAGVTVGLVKAPQSVSATGCTYGLRVHSKRLEYSLELLRKNGLSFGKVYEYTDDGGLREVSV